MLVRAGKPAVADHVGNQDRRDLAGLAHGAPLSRHRLAQTLPGQSIGHTAALARYETLLAPGAEVRNWRIPVVRLQGLNDAF